MAEHGNFREQPAETAKLSKADHRTDVRKWAVTAVTAVTRADCKFEIDEKPVTSLVADPAQATLYRDRTCETQNTPRLEVNQLLDR